jgi:hypothetical protein
VTQKGNPVLITTNTPRRLFGVTGALVVSTLLLAPYDFAAAAQAILALAQG